MTVPGETQTTPRAPGLFVPRVAFMATVNIGEITAATRVKAVTYTDARFIYPGLGPGEIVPIKGQVIGSSDEPVILCSCYLDSDITGTVEMVFYSTQTVDFDFGEKAVFFEMMTVYPENP